MDLPRNRTSTSSSHGFLCLHRQSAARDGAIGTAILGIKWADDNLQGAIVDFF